jgi:Rrf2 family cysteine metabolism transcriptional repressor
MKLSTKTRYGIRAMIELAVNFGQGALQIKTIAKNQDISIKYLEQIMTILRSGGLIRSVRGTKGGYLLAKPPGEIKLDEVFICLEGPSFMIECLENENACDRHSDCVARMLWGKVQQSVLNVLKEYSLQDMAELSKSKSSMNYSI